MVAEVQNTSVFCENANCYFKRSMTHFSYFLGKVNFFQAEQKKYSLGAFPPLKAA